jgi:chemotaxis receptor (MCP) glutamine deamidase CheD
MEIYVLALDKHKNVPGLNQLMWPSNTELSDTISQSNSIQYKSHLTIL